MLERLRRWLTRRWPGARRLAPKGWGQACDASGLTGMAAGVERAWREYRLPTVVLEELRRSRFRMFGPLRCWWHMRRRARRDVLRWVAECRESTAWGRSQIGEKTDAELVEVTADYLRMVYHALDKACAELEALVGGKDA